MRDKWQSLRFQFTWQSLFLNTWVSKNTFYCIFSLFWFVLLGLIRGEKLLDRKYVLLRQPDVKQKCCKVSFVGKNIIFHYFQDNFGWLSRRSALKSHLLITYLWLYVGLAIFPWKNKNKNYAGLGGCLLRWITSEFIGIILHILLSLIRSPWWAPRPFQ